MKIKSKIIRRNNIKHNNPNRQTLRNIVFEISN